MYKNLKLSTLPINPNITALLDTVDEGRTLSLEKLIKAVERKVIVNRLELDRQERNSGNPNIKKVAESLAINKKNFLQIIGKT